VGGTFILRIEDTDRERYAPESIVPIMDGLRWLGLDWDEGPGEEALRHSGVAAEAAEGYAVGGPHGPYVQSERLERYHEIAEALIERGWAYRCNCPPERLEEVRRQQLAQKQPVMYDRHCRNLPPGAVPADEPHVVRLKVPLTGETVVHDVNYGDVVYDNAGIDDQVLLKSDGFPTYQLAVVVDDHDMEVSHIARADHWLPSTPKHILLYQALEWELPTYCHVPLVLGEDGKPLAKRHGATAVTQFRELGYLPEALLNFLALLGWAPGEGEEQEVFTRQELIDHFDLFRVNRAPATFSYDKLDWMNGMHIRRLSEEELLERLIPFWQKAGWLPEPVPEDTREWLLGIIPLVQERLKRLTDVYEWTDIFFEDIDRPPEDMLIGKKLDAGQSLEVLRRARALLAETPDFSPEGLEGPLRGLAEEMDLKAGQIFGPLRGAVTAKKVSPPLFGTLSVIGRERVVKRLEAAERVLEESLD
jgi:glutamyl-tRNA synthetase